MSLLLELSISPSLSLIDMLSIGKFEGDGLYIYAKKRYIEKYAAHIECPLGFPNSA